MSDIKDKDNKFENQPEEANKTQRSSKVPPNVRMLSKKPVLSLILGLIGAALTAVSIIITYNSSKSISELLLPLLYNFIPFLISFMLIKIGIAGLLERKK